MNWMDGGNGFCLLLSWLTWPLCPVPRCRHGPGVGLSESSDERLRGPLGPLELRPPFPLQRCSSVLFYIVTLAL